MAEGDIMQQNRTLQINWGTFNIPTIFAVASVLWYTAGKQERQDSRLDAIEISRVQRSTEINKVLEALQMKIQPVDNITYRVTVLEQGVADVNRRIDRVGDSMQSIRNDIGTVSTQVQLVNQKLDAIFPGKKADLSPGQIRP